MLNQHDAKCMCVTCDCVTFVGATMSVVLDLSYTLCIWLSAAVAIVYTLLGGLYSVAYTDIIQLTLMFFSLVSLVRNKMRQISGNALSPMSVLTQQYLLHCI